MIHVRPPSERLDALKKEAVSAVHNALADILANTETNKDRTAIMLAVAANMIRAAEKGV